MNIFLAAHCDDETLFGAYTIIKHHPVVIIDDKEASEERRKESTEALKILGVEEDSIFFVDILNSDWEPIISSVETIWAPALEGGHKMHDLISLKADELFREKVVHYSSYRNPRDLQPKGNFKVPCTREMEKLKKEALECYKSQIIKTPCHFRLKNKDEYYVDYYRSNI